MASACSSRGLDTALLDPAPDRPWKATYGMWSRELPADLPASVVAARAAGRAIALTEPIAPAAALVARRHGFIINPVAPDALRLAPPLTSTTDQLTSFVDALPAILDEAAKESA